ncbi:MAG: Wzz/FepE/Etk N-terminal domain-containing protein [Hyphomicrobiales bacterium]|nr:Wzz/FepE/Etk N-terminal domain-containing protein [Hyphomicrobiales bacterium]
MLERAWPATIVQPRPQRERDSGFTSLADVLAFVRASALPISLFVVLGLLVAQLYVATTEPTYTASAEVLITPKLPASLQLQPSEVNLSLDTAQIESQIVVLQSEKIAKRVIDKLDLVHDADFTRTDTVASRLVILEHVIRQALGWKEETGKPWFHDDPADGPTDNSSEAEFVRARRTMGTFMKNLDVHRVGVSYALEIAFRSRDPQQAAQIANETADAYMREQLDTRVDDTENGLQWLEDRIEHIRVQMNDAAIAAQAFRSRHDYAIGARVPSPDGDAATGEGKGKGVTLEELEATADSYKKMYESFLQAFTTSANQRPSPDARVITVATSPLAPSDPRKKLILAFGAMSGIMLGVGLAFLRNLLDDAIRSPKQLREELGLECLGELSAAPHRSAGLAGFDEMMRAPGSPFARTMKGIKAAVGIAALDRPIRFIGVTSVSPHEGKSMLAGNLAALWAMSGARTLLIDADVEHSVISGMTRRDDCPDKDGKGIAWVAGIRPDPGHAFDILPGSVAEKHNLLTTENARETFATLDPYEVVIVDLPPFASGSHGLAVASQLDGVIVAIGWGKTSQSVVADLIHALFMAKASVLGGVLTRVRKSSDARLLRQAVKRRDRR